MDVRHKVLQRGLVQRAPIRAESKNDMDDVVGSQAQEVLQVVNALDASQDEIK